MLPELLSSSYKQYKTDTTKIASWLATTAEKCGWSPSTNTTRDSSTPDGTKNPKLKGRARKLARMAAAGEKKNPASTNASQKEPPKHIIRIKDFVPMAAYIASNSSIVQIPHGFFNLIRRCIIARNSTSHWYASNAAEDDPEANETTDQHTHFTTVLENVFRTLMASFSLAKRGESNVNPSKTQSDQQQSAEEAKTAPLANLFELLAVDDGNDDFENEEDATADGPTLPKNKTLAQPSKARYEIEHDEDDAEEEFFFAVYLLFRDLHRLRLVLVELWKKYRDRKIDLSVAAVVTNTAFDLVRKAETDFLHDMPIPSQYSDLRKGGDLCYLNYIDISVKKGCAPGDKERPSDGFDFKRYEDVEHCFLGPYLCLAQFGKEVEKRNGKIPMMSVQEERRLVTGPRSELTPRERDEEDTTILMSSVSVIASFVAISTAPSEDEFSAGIRELVEKRKLSLWLVFAAQNFLDVHHVLRTDVGRGLKDLLVAGRAAKATLEDHHRFMQANKCELRDRKDDHTCREMMRSIEEWGCNTPEAKLLNKHATRKSGVRWDENCVVKKHPLLAGLLKFSMHLEMQFEGILLLNSMTTALSVAHLYNAAQMEGYLPKDKPWHDLDFVLNVHSSQDIFVGSRPTNTEEYATRLSLAQGVSPETFARNRRSAGPKYSKKGSRELNAACPVAGAFRDQYCAGVSGEVSTQAAENLVRQLAFKEIETNLGMSKKLLAGLKPINSRGLRLSLQAFLTKLAQALQSEAAQYQFDYFALHRRTWTMLKAVKIQMRPIVDSLFNDTIMKRFDSDTGVVMVGSTIICMACDITKSPHLVNVKQSLHVTVEPLKIAAAEMEKLIDKEGDAEVKRLAEVCPGFAESESSDEVAEPVQLGNDESLIGGRRGLIDALVALALKEEQDGEEGEEEEEEEEEDEMPSSVE